VVGLRQRSFYLLLPSSYDNRHAPPYPEKEGLFGAVEEEHSRISYK
jgi:hypothetical protein